jgi:hypothetical protein
MLSLYDGGRPMAESDAAECTDAAVVLRPGHRREQRGGFIGAVAAVCSCGPRVPAPRWSQVVDRPSPVWSASSSRGPGRRTAVHDRAPGLLHPLCCAPPSRGVSRCGQRATDRMRHCGAPGPCHCRCQKKRNKELVRRLPWETYSWGSGRAAGAAKHWPAFQKVREERSYLCTHAIGGGLTWAIWLAVDRRTPASPIRGPRGENGNK